jgi:signal transduction histidine kinase
MGGNMTPVPEKRWFWATLTLSSITIVSIVFAAWELVENRLFRDADYLTLHYLYITRGVASSLLLAFWAAWYVLRQKRKSDEELRRQRERMIEIEKLTSMGKMAAGTAHHLNSPLAALLIRIQMMRSRTAGTPLDEDAARIEEGLQFCRHFVQRLLDFTRATPVQKGDQDLGAIVDSVCGFFQPAILSRRATLAVDTSEGRGQLVRADRNLLETLLLILLSNALDAVPEGGQIGVTCQHAAPDTVGFTVEDNGCGIAPADLERVFEPFFTTKEPGKGTGLGLAIARNVVLEHGGAIRIESEPGVRTTAYVDLPLAAAGEVAQSAAAYETRG